MQIGIWYKDIFLGICTIFKESIPKTNLYKIIISKEPDDRIGYNTKGRISKIRIFDVGDYIGEGNIVYDELVSSRCVGKIGDKLVMYCTYIREGDKGILSLISK